MKYVAIFHANLNYAYLVPERYEFVIRASYELILDTSMAGQSYTITGGTGRFAGATGSGTFIAAGSGEVELSWNGTIDFKD